jgi:hypothetical protein
MGQFRAMLWAWLSMIAVVIVAWIVAMCCLQQVEWGNEGKAASLA